MPIAHLWRTARLLQPSGVAVVVGPSLPQHTQQVIGKQQEQESHRAHARQVIVVSMQGNLIRAPLSHPTQPLQGIALLVAKIAVLVKSISDTSQTICPATVMVQLITRTGQNTL